jgi:hypothetical protein
MTQQDELRRAFEKLWGGHSKPSYDLISNTYNDSSMQKCWLFYQAALDAMDEKSAEIERLGEALHKADLEMQGYAVTLLQRDADNQRLQQQVEVLRGGLESIEYMTKTSKLKVD